jgi:hypothetical protein
MFFPDKTLTGTSTSKFQFKFCDILSNKKNKFLYCFFTAKWKFYTNLRKQEGASQQLIPVVFYK